MFRPGKLGNSIRQSLLGSANRRHTVSSGKNWSFVDNVIYSSSAISKAQAHRSCPCRLHKYLKFSGDFGRFWQGFCASCLESREEKNPHVPPPLSEFLRLLTRLGGGNNRPSEPPPGPQTVWVGRYKPISRTRTAYLRRLRIVSPGTARAASRPSPEMRTPMPIGGALGIGGGVPMGRPDDSIIVIIICR